MGYKTKKFKADDQQEFKYILGAFLKYHRLQERLSLVFISDVIHINKGYLSEVENGKRFLAPKHIDEVMGFLGIKFDDNKNILLELRKLLKELMTYYISIDYDEITKKVLFIYDKESHYLNSYGFFVYHLIKLLFEILIHGDTDSIIEIEQLLLNYTDALNDEEQIIFFILMANYYMQCNDIDKSYIYINQGYEKLEIFNNTLYLSILKHIEAGILSYLGFGNRAYICSIDALKYFQSTYYFKRILAINNTIGLSLVAMGLYKDAESHYLTVLNSLDGSAVEEKITILNNLSWCCTLGGMYDNAIYYSDLALKSGSKFKELLINKPYSLYKLDMKNEAAELIIEELKNDLPLYFECFLEVLYYRIVNDENMFIIKAKDLYELTIEKKDIEIRKLVLDLMIEYYKEKKDYSEIIECLENMLSCYRTL
ncbi:helix-turn-helix transcriptional regulator [Amedibacterium intestinale]|uniref:helix-turn-helix transcriptional regulator n=1 Tax=Amedibacterium intestinale TaxID=2583452 RepID=UPI000E4C637D|nr:helix-turn-helix transcriptional regulator [Amedibacterium intestinale]RHO21375.1 hypothetical protein DW220_07130 [Eubacterium sp. AM18-26]RHO28523.1 hypothetical protein DW212_01805 [Eubacterium sp. AM18-10LB-B]